LSRFFFGFIIKELKKPMEEKFDAEFRVRLPSELADRIAKAADKERRSRNSQYVFMLESYFERDNAVTDRIKALEERADVLESREKTGRPKSGKAVG
jgi:predicted transcriptional regulator